MRVGDLIRYSHFPENGYGIILDLGTNDNDYILFYWWDKNPAYNDYLTESIRHLEVLSASR